MFPFDKYTRLPLNIFIDDVIVIVIVTVDAILVFLFFFHCAHDYDI